MIATYVPPQRYQYTRLDATEAYWTALGDLGLEPTVPLVSVLVAHGALECGNFSAGLWNNNPGNIKASTTYARQYTCITVNEILKDKSGGYRERWFAPEGELQRKGGPLLEPRALAVPPGHPQTRMRSYVTLDDGIEDKVRFLLQSRYSKALLRAKAGDPAGFVREIRRLGYFTAYADYAMDKITPYETSVVKLTNQYAPLVVQVQHEGAPKGPHVPSISTRPVPVEVPTRFDIRELVESLQFDLFHLELDRPRSATRGLDD